MSSYSCGGEKPQTTVCWTAAYVLLIQLPKKINLHSPTRLSEGIDLSTYIVAVLKCHKLQPGGRTTRAASPPLGLFNHKMCHTWTRTIQTLILPWGVTLSQYESPVVSEYAVYPDALPLIDPQSSTENTNWQPESLHSAESRKKDENADIWSFVALTTSLQSQWVRLWS